MAPTTRGKKNPLPTFPGICSPPPAPGARATRFKDDDPFERVFNSIDDVPSEEEDADDMDFGKKRKRGKGNARGDKRSAKKRQAVLRAATRQEDVPPLPDDDCVTFADETFAGIVHRDEPMEAEAKNPSLRKDQAIELLEVLSIQVHGQDGNKTVINIADLLQSHGLLVTASPPSTPVHKRISEAFKGAPVTADYDEDVTLVQGVQAMEKVEKKGFLDIPLEIRLYCYRLVFCRDEPINFATRRGFGGRSSALLRTCKQVHEEGRIILYSENSFHFERNLMCRGSYFEAEWTEVGFKDVRRFLEAVGPVNISLMQFVSFVLTDGASNSRFVDDLHLQQCFRLIGSNTTLNILAFMFATKVPVSVAHLHFLRAFTDMRCHHLILLRRVVTGCKVTKDNTPLLLRDQLKSVMRVDAKATVGGGPVPSNPTKVKMVYEYHRWQCHYDWEML